MGEALLTRRGGGGGKIKNGIVKTVLPIEDIRQNMFVESVPNMLLTTLKQYMNGVVSYDGENFLGHYYKRLYFITKNSQGVYEQSDGIELGFKRDIRQIHQLSNQFAIVILSYPSSENPTYWHIVKTDFVSKTASIVYTSSPYAGQTFNSDSALMVNVSILSQTRFLLMFLTNSNNNNYNNMKYEFSLYSIDSSGKPTREHNWLYKYQDSNDTGYIITGALGKFNEGEDEKGKYGLYWAHVDYSNTTYGGAVSNMRLCFRLSVKIYYSTGEYVELYKINSAGSSLSEMPPGMAGSQYIIKNTIINLGSVNANIIKFGNDYKPVSNTPTTLSLPEGLDIKSGFGSKTTISYKKDSFAIDELYFVSMPKIRETTKICMNRIVATEDFVRHEFLYLIGDYTMYPIEQLSMFSNMGDSWFKYGKQGMVANVRGTSVDGIYYLDPQRPLVKKADKYIYGVSGIKELKKNEVGTVYSI